MIRISIPNWHPTKSNQLVGVHYHKAAKLKKSDSKMIWAYSARITDKPKIKQRLTLEIHISGRGRTPDPDAYFKSLNDALVKNGLLVDDSDKWVELAPVKFIRGKEKKTVIILEGI